MAKKHDAPFVVDVPNASADQPSWLRVGIFAVVGLVVGIGWPRVFGVRLGPSAPAAAVEAQSGARPADLAPSLPANALAANSAASGVNVPPGASIAAGATGGAIENNSSTVEVKHGVVVSCHSDSGELLKGAACGNLDFDSIALPRLKKLSRCPTAQGADGKLSVLFALDFESNKVRIDVGRSTTIDNRDTFGVCLRGDFDAVSLGAMQHDNPRYLVSYAVRFAPKGSVTPASGGSTPTSAATTTTASTPTTLAAKPTADVAADTAQVVWEVAIVRDAPRTGQVVARLQRGTAVQLATGQEGWYRVRYGANFTSEGWVYRAAVGK